MRDSGSNGSGVDIFVVGDVHQATIILPLKTPTEDGHKRVKFKKNGGALLLSDAIKHAVMTLRPEPKLHLFNLHRANVARDLDEETTYQWREALARFEIYPRTRTSKHDDEVYRLAQSHEWVDRGTAKQHENLLKRLVEDLKTNDLAKLPKQGKNDERQSRILVIYEHKNESFGFLKSANYHAPFLTAVKEDQDVIVWLMNCPLGQGNLWAIMRTKPGYLQRTAAVIPIERLREAGLNVRHEGSLEQIAQDFLAGVQSSGTLSDLAQMRDLIVLLEDSVLHYHNSSNKSPDNILADVNSKSHDGIPHDVSGTQRLKLHYCPWFGERAQPQSAEWGLMPGAPTVLVASIVRALAKCLPKKNKGGAGKIDCNIDDQNTSPCYLAIQRGLRLGIALAGQGYRNGFAKPSDDYFKDLEKKGESNEPQPFNKLFDEYDNWIKNRPDKQQETRFDAKEFAVATVTFPTKLTDLSEWTRINGFLDRQTSNRKDKEKALFRIVREGLHKVVVESSEMKRDSMEFPEPVTFCPYATFGKIQTADRDEIDRFQSTADIMQKYLQTKNWQLPLSVAVFGPPGSGKSFTIKQILADLNPDIVKFPLEYNVAQFTGVRDLAVACHQAQDRALAGDVPLVVFDEFDSNLDGDRLGWLKYFLSPMQDGKFKDGESTYQVGRAIFVFAGGTAHSFNEFAQQSPDDPSFRAAKGPDFISRLRAHLDIAGVDCEGSSVSDVLMFRRAIILRELLKDKPTTFYDETSKKVSIADEVIRAFLRVRAYKHGVRSMKAIVEMATISRLTTKFQKSSVPPRTQLDMHVDSREFLRWMFSPP